MFALHLDLGEIDIGLVGPLVGLGRPPPSNAFLIIPAHSSLILSFCVDRSFLMSLSIVFSSVASLSPSLFVAARMAM